MNVVMPPLLHSAQLKPDVTITSADSDADIDESDDERFEFCAFIIISTGMWLLFVKFFLPLILSLFHFIM